MKFVPPLSLRRLALAVALVLIGPQAHAEDAALDQAIARGVVNWRVDSQWPASKDANLALLERLHPGLIYKVGLRNGWGQINQGIFTGAGDLAKFLKARIPGVLLGIGMGESVRPDLDVTLDCAGMGSRRFTGAQITQPAKPLLGGTAWVDVATEGGRDFYECQSRNYVAAGYSLINLDGGGLVIKNASSKEAAVRNINAIFARLKTYAQSIGGNVYFSGDLDMVRDGVKVDTAYLPSRFYHLTVPEYKKYQNKVSRPGVGVGYSYVLSSQIVTDARAKAPASVRLFFYIDNWDPAQDDLRRFMELDAANRRFLVTESAKAAHAGGAYFIPSLNHCDGCVNPSVIGDHCELLPQRQDKTEYDATRCGDEASIAEALDLESPRRKPERANR